MKSIYFKVGGIGLMRIVEHYLGMYIWLKHDDGSGHFVGPISDEVYSTWFPGRTLPYYEAGAAHYLLKTNESNLELFNKLLTVGTRTCAGTRVLLDRDVCEK
jgi:hypothetical protein